jgi:hypothetical protein
MSSINTKSGLRTLTESIADWIETPANELQLWSLATFNTYLKRGVTTGNVRTASGEHFTIIPTPRDGEFIPGAWLNEPIHLFLILPTLSEITQYATCEIYPGTYQVEGYIKSMHVEKSIWEIQDFMQKTARVLIDSCVIAPANISFNLNPEAPDFIRFNMSFDIEWEAGS